MQNEEFSKEYFEKIQHKAASKIPVDQKDLSYFVFRGKVENMAYSSVKERINIMYKNGEVTDMVTASDNLSLQALTNSVTKHFICHPKNL